MKPVRVIKPGELVFDGAHLYVRNWELDFGGRPGTIRENAAEALLAIRDYVVADIETRISVVPDSSFDRERLDTATIVQMEFMKRVQRPKRAWWKVWG